MANNDVKTNDIRTALMSIRGKGNLAFEPKINKRLGELYLKTDEQNANEIKDGIMNWLRGKFPNSSDDKLLNIVDQKGGFVALTPAYLVTEIQKEIEKEELEADRLQDNEQNQDLFELVNNKNNIRLQDRQALERDLQDRQRSVAERSLRILEAMEKVKDAIVQGKENLELDLSCFRELGPEELSKQMSFLERFGLKQMDLENGEIVFSIPMRELHSPMWERKAEAYKAQFKERGIGKDRAGNGVRIADDVPALRREQEQKQNETRADEEMVM